MKLLFTLAIAFLIQHGMQAQTVQWAKKAGGNPFDRGYGIATDAAGNSYTTGYFRGTVAFGSTTLISSGGDDIYVAKLDAAGNFLWATKAGGTGSLDGGYAIAIDAAGNSYVTGWFSGTAAFGSTTLTTVGNVDVFIAKLDPAGNFLWAHGFGGDAGDVGHGIATDAAGNSYVTGSFSGTVVLGGTTLATTSNDVFITKLDTEGNYLWATKAEGAAAETGYAIAIDASGNSYVTGQFGSYSADPGHTATFGSTTLTSSGGYEIFIAKLDAEGDFSWAVQAGGASNDGASGIATDAAGNCYVTGYFCGSAGFGELELTAASADERDILIAKLDSEGNFLWAKKAGSSAHDGGFGIAADASGNCYVAGSFSGTVAFGGTTLTSASSSDIFITKLDTDGGFLWAQRAAGGAPHESIDPGNGSIATDAAGNCYVTGWFRGTADFGGITLTASGSSDDIFIFKIGDGTASVHEAAMGHGVAVHPNPAHSMLHIRSDGPVRVVRIYDALGALVRTGTRASFSVEELPAGVYMVQVSTEKGMGAMRLVKE